MKKLFFVLVCFLFAEALSADNMLVRVSDVPKDGNEPCPNGGKKIEIVLDKNDNGQIDDEDEIDKDQTQTVCNGVDGEDGTTTVVSLAQDDGTFCKEAGGIVVTAGNKSLPVCNGQAGADALINTTEIKVEDPDSPCTNGGIKIEVGLDNNLNKMLDTDEVTKTKYVCNGANGGIGANGKNALSRITEITDDITDSPCTNGGIKIEVGIDNNGDGKLADTEINNEQTNYVCNGKDSKYQGEKGEKGPQGNDGENGKDGKDGEPGEKGDTGEKGEQGPQGETGASGENGKDGTNSLVSLVAEPKGENCVSGGQKILIGLDSNRNGILDENEIDYDSVYYACNGSNAKEAGLTSSSTGCSLEVIDENGSLISAVLALFAAVFAAFAFKNVRS